MSIVSSVTLALSGVFALIAWMLALIALNNQGEGLFTFGIFPIAGKHESLWTRALHNQGNPGTFLAAASFVFIISITAWLPSFLSFAGAAMACKEPARARPFGFALGCVYMLYMILATLYFIYYAELHPTVFGPQLGNRERHYSLECAPFHLRVIAFMLY